MFEAREFINGGTDWNVEYFTDVRAARAYLDEILDGDDDAFPWGAEVVNRESGKRYYRIDPAEDTNPRWNEHLESR
jgi:hypothetical protein